MSYVEIFVIQNNGEVCSRDEIRCSGAGAAHILDSLCFDRGIPRGQGGSWDWAVLYKLFNEKALPTWEAILVGFCADQVWVRKENIPKLVEALEKFWESHQTLRYLTNGANTLITPTIPKIISSLREIFEKDQNIRGVCFNQTSINGDYWAEWRVPIPFEEAARKVKYRYTSADTYSRSPEYRPFNFDRDKQVTAGRIPWELFDSYSPV